MIRSHFVTWMNSLPEYVAAITFRSPGAMHDSWEGGEAGEGRGKVPDLDTSFQPTRGEGAGEGGGQVVS